MPHSGPLWLLARHLSSLYWASLYTAACFPQTESGGGREEDCRMSGVDWVIRKRVGMSILQRSQRKPLVFWNVA